MDILLGQVPKEIFLAMMVYLNLHSFCFVAVKNLCCGFIDKVSHGSKINVPKPTLKIILKPSLNKTNIILYFYTNTTLKLSCFCVNVSCSTNKQDINQNIQLNTSFFQLYVITGVERGFIASVKI